MNILQIVPELRSGGVERGTVDFAKYLVAQEHHSVVVSAGGSLVQSMVEAGVTHYTLPVHKKSFFSILAQAKTIAKILRSERIDLVHARSRVPAWIAFLACRQVRVPLVTTCHGVYSRHALSRVMGWGKFVIAISHAVSRHMKEEFGVPYDRIRLIHRGVNLREFVESEPPKDAIQNPPNVQHSPVSEKKEFIIGIVGRITAIKGHGTLLKAMARVTRLFPNAKLWVIGESPRRRYRDELGLLTRKLGIESSVEFMGTRHDMPQLLRQMDLLVAPAVGEEAFGRVLIEAGACGVPVIASRIGGIVDVVDHGENGLLVPAGDAAALGEAIIGVLRDPEHARQRAHNLKRKVYEVFSDKRMFEQTVEVYREAVDQQKILVLKLSALGDVILSTPSFRAIREKYPKAKIVALVERPSLPVLRHCPYVDDVLTFERFPGLGQWPVLRLGRILAREHFDICVDLQNSRLSHCLAYLSGAHTRVGYATGKCDFFLNTKIKDNREAMNPVQHQFRTLGTLGITPGDSRLELWIDRHDEDSVSRFLKDHWLGEGQTLVGLNPGSSPLWKTKRWPVERFAFLCDALSKENIRVVITGAPQEAALAKAISRKCRSKPMVAVGKTSVGELIALIKRCQVFVTSDSAPMHIASAVGTSFVALFGPTDPRRHVQPSAQASHVIWKEVKCSPCYLKKCSIGLLCMKQITQEEVLTRIKELISSQTSPNELGKSEIQTSPISDGSAVLQNEYPDSHQPS